MRFRPGLRWPRRREPTFIAQLREGAPDFKYGVFKLPPLRAGNISTSAAAGRLSPTPRDGIRRPPTKSALDAGKAAFENGFLKIFTDEICPGARAEPRMPPPVYKAISDAIQACQLNGQIPPKRTKPRPIRSTRFSRTIGTRRPSDA